LGVDTGKWNYAEVTEWFFDRYDLDLNVSAKAKVLFHHKFHEEDFDEELDRLMYDWQIQAAVTDADPKTMECRRFARRFPGFVWLCRFRRGVTAKEIAVTETENYAPIATVDRTAWFSAALGRFRKPRRITLPRDISYEYREHIKAPVHTYVKEGSLEEKRKNQTENLVAKYISIGTDHFALARVYSEIALPFAASVKTNEDIKKFL
jgi:hypothetical protein